MPWSSLASNQAVSFTNLLDAVNTGVFQQKATITGSSEQITKADANTYVNINTAYAPYSAKASNQLVVKSDLQSGISAPYQWTFWYQSCCSGCIDPEVRLQGKDGYIRAGDLKVGDEVESDLGYGVVSYIEYKQQPKFLVATANRIAPVSDTHQFIDGEGNIILASDLTVGSLVNTDEGVEEITSISEKHIGEVIDITVEGTHQYYANGFLSHNKPCFTYAGWATAAEACIYWGTFSWNLWSVDNPIVAGSKLYGSSTGGAAPPICSGYPYLFSNYLNQWIEVTQSAPEYDFDVVSIGTCTADIYIQNISLDIPITGMTINGVSVSYSSGANFTITAGNNGNFTSGQTGTYTVVISYGSHISGQNITFTDSDLNITCKDLNGSAGSFTIPNAVITAGTTVYVTASDGACI